MKDSESLKAYSIKLLEAVNQMQKYGEDVRKRLLKRF